MKKKANMRKKLKSVADRSLMRNPPRILLAEDDDEMRILLGRALRKAGYRVIEDYDGTSLLDDLISSLLPEKEGEQIDLVISDIRMPGPSVIEILRNVLNTDGLPPVILITAFGDKEIHAAAKQCGVAAMFDKPFDIDDLVAKVREIIYLPGRLSACG